MSDHRDDEPTSEPSEDAPPPPDEAGSTPGGDDSFEIQEMTPPPPGERDATSAMPTPPPGAAAPPPPSAPAGSAPEPSATPRPGAAGPPTGGPPPPSSGSDAGGSHPWPSSAKAVVAVLVVLVLAGIAGTVIGFTRASSAEDDIDATSGDLTAERERADTAEAEAEELGESLIAVTQERDQLLAERDELAAERDELAAERDELAAERDEAIAVGEAEQARLEAEIVELEERVVELEDELADVDEAAGEIDEVFPLSLRVDLGEVDIAGTYAVSLTEIQCSGLDGLCGSAPGLDDATISDGLRLTIPDTLDVPLTVVDGTAFGPADSESIVPPCGDEPRSTSLTMALFDDGVEIDAQGDAEVTALGATIVIDAPATEECDIGRAWYRAELTPR